ncbi:cytochrome c3 family protein [Geothrix terrae]|uniref:cytochrome c3 family protein n=1 Tax=Geothrix terrae TaxID=2922720 RepID=UPI0023DF1726|nr:cytochrome c3 family protein [Geothrix terrae]
MSRCPSSSLCLWLALAGCGWLPSALYATDPPHNIATANSYGSLNYCSTCHKVMGGASGATLTTVSGNVNLCLSCHVSGGKATNQAFTATDQAVPADASLVGATAGGTSHRWDSSAAGRLIKGSPNTSTATIASSGDYTGAYAATIMIQVTTGGATGTAKVAWSQTTNGTSTFGGATTITTSTTPQALGSSGVSLAFSGTGTFVLNDIFYLYLRPDLVQPTSGMSTYLEGGKLMCSTCHDQHLQALAPFDPNASQTYTAGTTNNRHFQRVRNDDGSMCGDCHAARNVGKGGTSHPVHVNLASAPNTKTPTLGTVLSAAGNVECLTCHDVHKAPTTTAPAGMLLRVSNSLALCTDCHTLADTTTANVHTNPTSGILWPGDGYGGSTYPAITDTTLRGACKNCHTPHGWPDANNPGGRYAFALGARQDNLCETCHDGTPAKDVRTEILKTNHHPVERTSGHTVGCADCHNPHMATPGVHTYTTTADANRNRLRADAGGVLNNMYALRGVDGVQFNYTGLGLWPTPTAATFTKVASGSPAVAASGATYEYQVCFKCHTSYDSYGATRPGGVTTFYNTGTAKFTNGSTTVAGTGTTWVVTTTATNSETTPGRTVVGMYIQKNITSPAYKITAATATSITLATPYTGTTDATAAAYVITREQTDLAQEFSPSNASGHPVVTGLNNYTGNVAPKALSASFMKAPWTAVGTQTMMCSDCHNTNGTAAQGPHGSANQFMLREFAGGAPAANWPNVTLTATLGSTVASQSWCNNCHQLTTALTNDVHTKNSTHEGHQCFACHVVIPHGSKMSRLMACNTNMPARYAYQGDRTNTLILQFKKAAVGTYATSNCDTTVHHSALTGTGVESW